ncbi:MAG: competence/damage-inducible protein A [Bacteroidales bacterium]|nr:competence/damage-inducible protein A [Bacteroidales bacterium]MDD2813148.1 competence/damage-inducible protein A [Bacteroidales bacterium]MDD3385062.1 competence/damage-inducible protein A [Bacteroidales bacterium]
MNKTNPIAEIIAIGDEILIGQTVNTNSAWIGQRMSEAGIPVKRAIVISDDPTEIAASLEEALQRADIVLITGGLGPTRDDLTKNTLAQFFGSTLVRDDQVTQDILKLLASRNVPMIDLNLDQALVPNNCRVIRNTNGTAPGMWFEKDQQVIVSMPGVPYEMKVMMDEQVIPALLSAFKVPAIVRKTVMTTGIPESKLAASIADWELSLPEGVSLAYLPSPGIVKLRLSVSGENQMKLRQLINNLADQLVTIIPEAVFGYDDLTLEEVVGVLLRERKQTVATAESCTGGTLASLITRVPGSSDYYKGSIVAYANEIKTTFLKVPGEMIQAHGAVSCEVVERMATNIRDIFAVDYAVAISGIAGPAGGTTDKPVGTTWIGVASSYGVESACYQMGEHRERTIHKAALAGLNLLRLSILKDARG